MVGSPAAIWNSSNGLWNLKWEGSAFISCDRRNSTVKTRSTTMFGVANAWTIWGCEWGKSLQARVGLGPLAAPAHRRQSDSA